MKRAYGGQPLPRLPEPEAGRSLEIQIEMAWLQLCARRGGKPVTLYLTYRDNIVGFMPSAINCACDEIGTYSSAIELADFRADVFWTKGQRRGA